MEIVVVDDCVHYIGDGSRKCSKKQDARATSIVAQGLHRVRDAAKPCDAKPCDGKNERMIDACYLYSELWS